MKQTLRFACVVLLLSSSLIAFNACNDSKNSTTNTDSTSNTTITADTTSHMNKMSDSGSMRKMTDSAVSDTGGRNTQNIPPPKPKGQ